MHFYPVDKNLSIEFFTIRISARSRDELSDIVGIE